MFEIRQADLADMEVLADLRVAFLQEVAQAAGQRDLPDPSVARAAIYQYLLAHMPKGDFLGWVAEAEGRIVGTSGLAYFRKPPTFKNLTGLDAYVMSMYTLPAWRGRGVARTLLQCAIAHARASGAKRVWLHATANGRPLYEKVGFVGTDDEMELYLP
ncbi:MAG TPA: GNAT family N-acetyltransferase [Chthonomonadaceae bacterium]|nr:GNAT family N-acetyltransferase [Chthonomonadaceae bacterium]